MSSLKFGMRDTTIKYNKRAVVPMSKVFEVVTKAQEEKIPSYMIMFAYNGELHSVGYEENGEVKYNYGKPDGETVQFNTFDELVNACNFEGNVNVLRELQGLQLGEIVETSINDNYLLRDYLIDETNPNYNYNMSQNLITMLDDARKKSEKDTKGVKFFLIGCVVFIVVCLAVAILLGNS